MQLIKLLSLTACSTLAILVEAAGQSVRWGLEIGMNQPFVVMSTSVPFNQETTRPSGRPGLVLAVQTRWKLSAQSGLTPFVQLENRSFREKVPFVLMDDNGGPIRDIRDYPIRNYLARAGILYSYQLNHHLELLGGFSFDYLLLSRSRFAEGLNLIQGEAPLWFKNHYYRKYNGSVPVGIQYNAKVLFLKGLFNYRPFSSFNNLVKERQHTLQLTLGIFLTEIK